MGPSWLVRIGFVFLALLSIQAQAGEAIDFKIHNHFVSPRALGMGDAFTAVADDHTAIFYNPAALARREDGVMNLYLEKATIGGDILPVINDISEAASRPETERVGAIGDVLDAIYGTNYQGRLSMFGGFWARPNWGMAFVPFDLTTDIGVYQQVGAQLNFITRVDTTYAFAVARNYPWLGKHKLSLGVTTKVINRIFVDKGLQAFELALDPDALTDPTDLQEGLTIDADVGALITPEIPDEGIFSWLKVAKPTFAVVVRNVLDYGYLTSLNVTGKHSNNPPLMQRRLDLGSTWEYPKFWKFFKPRGTLDIRNIGHRNWSFLKGLHVGAELDWDVGDWLNGGYRIGFNQGYLTAGLSAKFVWFNLDLATWGEEVGTSEQRAETRNFQLKMSMDF